jgi:hypothetical protein
VDTVIKYSEGYPKMGFCWAWDEEKRAENCPTRLLFKFLIMCVCIFSQQEEIRLKVIGYICRVAANAAALIHSSNESVSIKVVGLEELFVRRFTVCRLVDITEN